MIKSPQQQPSQQPLTPLSRRRRGKQPTEDEQQQQHQTPQRTASPKLTPVRDHHKNNNNNNQQEPCQQLQALPASPLLAPEVPALAVVYKSPVIHHQKSTSSDSCLDALPFGILCIHLT
jgi:hypothetical protein